MSSMDRRRRSRSPRYERDHRDKDRESHRDPDRETHRDRDRDSRRDRDTRDTHRGRERESHRERDRRSRSRSPSYERRRKDRQRTRISGWDVPPTASQLAAQAAALAAAVTAPPINHMNPSMMHPSRPMPMQSFQSTNQSINQSNQNSSATRQARRLYIGNLPVPLDESELRVLFNAAFPAGFPHVPPGDCVISVYLNIEKKFGFVEFRTPEEATMALALDGILLRGQPLRVKRPSDYQAAMYPSNFCPPPINQSGISHFMPSNSSMMQLNQSINQSINQSMIPGQLSNQVPDGPNKVFCGGLPYAFGDEEIKELLSSFGSLRAFHLVQDKETGQSRGYCFFEYADSSVTDEAVKSLNTMRIGERTLTVRRAQPKESSNNVTNAAMGLLSAIQAAGGNVNQLPISPPSRVLVLRNMLSDAELNDREEYADVCEEIQCELSKYGRLLHFEIPKPGQAGVGRVFLEYSDLSEAIRAQIDIQGREFAGRYVQAEFMDVDKFKARQFD